MWISLNPCISFISLSTQSCQLTSSTRLNSAKVHWKHLPLEGRRLFVYVAKISCMKSRHSQWDQAFTPFSFQLTLCRLFHWTVISTKQTATVLPNTVFQKFSVSSNFKCRHFPLTFKYFAKFSIPFNCFRICDTHRSPWIHSRSSSHVFKFLIFLSYEFPFICDWFFFYHWR